MKYQFAEADNFAVIAVAVLLTALTVGVFTKVVTNQEARAAATIAKALGQPVLQASAATRFRA